MAATRTALEEAWSLHERMAAAFARPLSELAATVRLASDGPALAEANEPARYLRACMCGLAAVTDLTLDETLPAPIRAALRELPAHYQEHLTTLSAATAALTAAAPDLRTMQSFEGVAGLLHGATQAANPTTPVGVAAIGGATLGTLLLPGIGTAIGGALGVLLGGRQVSRRDRLALQRFAEATKAMASAVDDLQHGLWNQLVRSIRDQGGPRLPDSAFFETAAARWETLRAEAVPPAQSADYRRRLDTFLGEWGPLPEALHVAGRLCLPPYPLDVAALTKYAASHRGLYAADANGYETEAALALEENRFDEALRAAEAGLQSSAAHAGLRNVRLEALAALGRLPEAEAAARPAQQGSSGAAVELALIRGLVRGQHRCAAVEAVRSWIRRDRKPALIARHLAEGRATAALLAEGAAPIPELAGLPHDAVDTRLQAAVERHLNADGAQSYFGSLPADKADNAREAFLQLRPDEWLLYFRDWSLWHNARTGLALTNRRILWKSSWQDPVAIELSSARGLPVSAKQSVLHVGAKTVDVEDEPLANALVLALREMLTT